MKCEQESFTKPKRRKIPLYLREAYENVIRVDYMNDTRSMIGKVVGDPLPDHAALRVERSKTNG